MFKKWRDWHHPNVKYNVWNPTPKFDNSTENKSENFIFFLGMLPPVTWKRQGFCCKSCAGTKLWSSTAASAGESWKTGVCFKSDWRQFEDQGGRWVFLNRLKLVSKWIQQCSPATICWFFDVSLDETFEVVIGRMLHSRSSVFLSCFNDSEMCLRLFSVRVFLEIWFFYTGSSWTTWCFFFYCNWQNSAGKVTNKNPSFSKNNNQKHQYDDFPVENPAVNKKQLSGGSLWKQRGWKHPRPPPRAKAPEAARQGSRM